MNEGWREVTVDDIKGSGSSALATGPFGSSISSRFFQTQGVPVIRGSNLSADVGIRFVPQDFVFVSEEKAKQFKRSVVRSGDLVFTCWGTIGQVGLIEDEDPYPEYIISNKQMKLTPDQTKANSRFLYYLFSSPEMLERVGNMAIGTSVPGFNLGQLRSLKFRLPPHPTQRRIAQILGRLDDKIEVNRRINRTLEIMAQALFKHWFVDFGPFQDGPFVESELGLIPEGWKLGRLSDLFILQRGFDLPKSKRQSGPYPIMSASGFTDTHSDYKVAGPGVTTGRSGQLGDVFFILENFWPLNTTLWIKEYRNSRPVFAYHYLRTLDLTVFNSGSAVPTLNRNDVHELPAIVPPLSVISQFEGKVEKWFIQRHKNQLENCALAAARDYLLPRLLSGEVAV